MEVPSFVKVILTRKLKDQIFYIMFLTSVLLCLLSIFTFAILSFDNFQKVYKDIDVFYLDKTKEYFSNLILFRNLYILQYEEIINFINKFFDFDFYATNYRKNMIYGDISLNYLSYIKEPSEYIDNNIKSEQFYFYNKNLEDLIAEYMEDSHSEDNDLYESAIKQYISTINDKLYPSFVMYTYSELLRIPTNYKEVLIRDTILYSQSYMMIFGLNKDSLISKISDIMGGEVQNDGGGNPF